MAWILFGFSALFFGLLGKYRHWSRSTTGALILVGGLGNTSFFGLPMIEAFYGKAGMTTGIIVDQLGSFFVLSVLGMTVAGLYSSGRPTAAQIIKRIALFPPFISLILALVLIPLEYADWFVILLKRLGDTLAPLALVSVGLQLRLGHIAEHKRNLALGLSFKLFLAPLLIYFLYVPLFGGHGQTAQITVFEAAMPSMITASIVASEHHLNPPLANLMVAVGLIVSFFSLTAWWWLLQGV
jgi:predicted permease